MPRLTWESDEYGDASLSDGIAEYAQTRVEFKSAFLTLQTDADHIYPSGKEHFYIAEMKETISQSRGSEPWLQWKSGEVGECVPLRHLGASRLKSMGRSGRAVNMEARASPETL